MSAVRGEGFRVGLEQALSIYERLCLRGKLPGGCRSCPVAVEVGKPLELERAARLERVEEEMGYSLR